MTYFEPSTQNLFGEPVVPARPGIQPGQVAWSKSSQMLHGSTEAITKALVRRMQARDANVVWQKKLSPSDIIRIARLDVDLADFPITGVAPDGGVVLYRTRDRGLVPLLSVEAKEQQDRGNAIERWFKNFTALKIVGSRMAFVTFCSGEGAYPQGAICKTLNHAMLEHALSSREYRPRSWNRLYVDGPSMFRRRSGFSERQIEVILQHLLVQKVAEVKRR